MDNDIKIFLHHQTEICIHMSCLGRIGAISFTDDKFMRNIVSVKDFRHLFDLVKHTDVLLAYIDKDSRAITGANSCQTDFNFFKFVFDLRNHFFYSRIQ